MNSIYRLIRYGKKYLCRLKGYLHLFTRQKYHGIPPWTLNHISKLVRYFISLEPQQCIPSIKLIVLMLVNLPDQVFGLQIVEAKVHQLDFSLERIFLSLKEITVIFIHFLGRYGVDQGILYRNWTIFFSFSWQPDPLMEALEAVVGDHNSLGGRLEAAEADVEVYIFLVFKYEQLNASITIWYPGIQYLISERWVTLTCLILF